MSLYATSTAGPSTTSDAAADDLEDDETTESLPPFEILTRQSAQEKTLERIMTWWRDEGATHAANHDERTYPHGVRPQLVAEPESDEEMERWLTVLLLGAFHTMGRQRQRQHRGFLEHCESAGWTRQFVDPDTPPEFWTQVLEEYFDRRGNEGEWFHWIRMLPSIYVLSRFLSDYCDLFTSLNRWSGPLVLDDLLKPRSSKILSRGGPMPPALHKVTGLGTCFIVRELRRSGVVTNPHADRYCYVPTASVKRVVEAVTGSAITESGYQASPVIYGRMQDLLGADNDDFGGAYDIPFQRIAFDRALQERFFNGPALLYVRGGVDNG